MLIARREMHLHIIPYIHCGKHRLIVDAAVAFVEIDFYGSTCCAKRFHKGLHVPHLASRGDKSLMCHIVFLRSNHLVVILDVRSPMSEVHPLRHRF